MLQESTKEKQKENINKFLISDSDHLSLLNVYNHYIQGKNHPGFCKDNFINEKSLRKATQIANQLLGYLKTIVKETKETEEQKHTEDNELDLIAQDMDDVSDKNQQIIK